MQETLVTSSRRYYVYGLFKPCGTPFYIGKGSGSRINHHFRPSYLKVNTPKTGVIKKYGDSVIRSILCYFDCEDDAYDYEEWLISHYGLRSEGGLLVNYAKTRFEYSDAFTQEISSKGHLAREKTYPDWLVLSSLNMYEFGFDLSFIQYATGIPKYYLSAIIRGQKRRLTVGDPPEYRKPVIESRAIKLSDREVSIAIKMLSNGNNTWASVSRCLGQSLKVVKRSLPAGFSPNLRKTQAHVPDGRNLKPEFEAAVLSHVLGNLTLKSLMDVTGRPKSTCYNAMNRVKKALQGSEMAAGMGNGTSTSPAEKDNSANNLGNK